MAAADIPSHRGLTSNISDDDVNNDRPSTPGTALPDSKHIPMTVTDRSMVCWCSGMRDVCAN
eukprot:3186713-Rhodomonas_salina.1